MRYSHYVIVCAMEEIEARGFCFHPLSGDRRAHVGEQRPRAFARSGVFCGGRECCQGRQPHALHRSGDKTGSNPASNGPHGASGVTSRHHHKTHQDDRQGALDGRSDAGLGAGALLCAIAGFAIPPANRKHHGPPNGLQHQSV
jgi:hypothetical protein